MGSSSLYNYEDAPFTYGVGINSTDSSNKQNFTNELEKMFYKKGEYKQAKDKASFLRTLYSGLKKYNFKNKSTEEKLLSELYKKTKKQEKKAFKFKEIKDSKKALLDYDRGQYSNQHKGPRFQYQEYLNKEYAKYSGASNTQRNEKTDLTSELNNIYANNFAQYKETANENIKQNFSSRQEEQNTHSLNSSFFQNEARVSSMVIPNSRYHNVESRDNNIINEGFLSYIFKSLQFANFIKWTHLCAVVVIFWGFIAGMYFWNTFSGFNSFLYPQTSNIKNQIESLEIADEYGIASNSQKIGNVIANTNEFTSVQTKEYSLVAGDTLLGVAIANGISIDTLISWNNIIDSRAIQIGQKLIIPNKDGLLYKVKSNDTLSSIAVSNQVSTTSILDANNLQSSVLTPSMKLFIPGAKLNSFDRGLVLGTVFQEPVRFGRITSHYGYRISPISGRRSFHNGVDIAAPYGALIRASGSGVVIYKNENHPVFGKFVIIRHARGFQTLYTHMSRIYNISRGQRIERGTPVGEIGSTGHSTGPHIHFTVIKNGVTVNPLRYIRIR